MARFFASDFLGIRSVEQRGSAVGHRRPTCALGAGGRWTVAGPPAGPAVRRLRRLRPLGHGNATRCGVVGSLPFYLFGQAVTNSETAPIAYRCRTIMSPPSCRALKSCARKRARFREGWGVAVKAVPFDQTVWREFPPAHCHSSLRCYRPLCRSLFSPLSSRSAGEVRAVSPHPSASAPGEVRVELSPSDEFADADATSCSDLSRHEAPTRARRYLRTSDPSGLPGGTANTPRAWRAA